MEPNGEVPKNISTSVNVEQAWTREEEGIHELLLDSAKKLRELCVKLYRSEKEIPEVIKDRLTKLVARDSIVIDMGDDPHLHREGTGYYSNIDDKIHVPSNVALGVLTHEATHFVSSHPKRDELGVEDEKSPDGLLPTHSTTSQVERQRWTYFNEAVTENLTRMALLGLNPKDIATPRKLLDSYRRVNSTPLNALSTSYQSAAYDLIDGIMGVSFQSDSKWFGMMMLESSKNGKTHPSPFVGILQGYLMGENEQTMLFLNDIMGSKNRDLFMNKVVELPLAEEIRSRRTLLNICEILLGRQDIPNAQRVTLSKIKSFLSNSNPNGLKIGFDYSEQMIEPIDVVSPITIGTVSIVPSMTINVEFHKLVNQKVGGTKIAGIKELTEYFYRKVCMLEQKK